MILVGNTSQQVDFLMPGLSLKIFTGRTKDVTVRNRNYIKKYAVSQVVLVPLCGIWVEVVLLFLPSLNQPLLVALFEGEFCF